MQNLVKINLLTIMKMIAIFALTIKYLLIQEQNINDTIDY